MEAEDYKYPKVYDFADLMHTRMECNDYKDDEGWFALSDDELVRRLKNNLLDLEKRMKNPDWAGCDAATDQLLDIGNYAMMLADNNGVLD